MCKCSSIREKEILFVVNVRPYLCVKHMRANTKVHLRLLQPVNSLVIIVTKREIRFFKLLCTMLANVQWDILFIYRAFPNILSE